SSHSAGHHLGPRAPAGGAVDDAAIPPAGSPPRWSRPCSAGEGGVVHPVGDHGPAVTATAEEPPVAGGQVDVAHTAPGRDVHGPLHTRQCGGARAHFHFVDRFVGLAHATDGQGRITHPHHIGVIG